MTKLVRLLTLFVLSVGIATEARGQFKEPVTITDMRVGLPPGQFTSQRTQNGQAAHIVKRNTWAPVYLQLKVEKEVEGGIAARVETSDDHDLSTSLTVPLLPTIADRLPGTLIEPVELGQLPYVSQWQSQRQIFPSRLSPLPRVRHFRRRGRCNCCRIARRPRSRSSALARSCPASRCR